MESMVSKTFLKVIGFAGSVLLTLFSGAFAMLSLFALVMSIVDGEFVSFVGCVGAGIAAWILWSIRKDTLV